MGLEINLGVLLTQTINFLIIVYLLQRFLYKPVIGMLDKRRNEIEKGLELKNKMQEEQEKLESRKKKIVREASDEGQRIINVAVQQAKKEQEEIILEAKKNAGAEYEKMQNLAAREKEKMFEEAREAALTYAVAISEKLLNAKLTKEEQKRLLDQSIRELGQA